MYRTGEIEIPNILHQESLSLMIDELIKYSQNSKNNHKIFDVEPSFPIIHSKFFDVCVINDCANFFKKYSLFQDG